jgi:predicted nucleic acid-binding protein
VTLVDTSAWVEYLRASGSSTHQHLRRLLQSDSALHTTDVVVMEVLAGGRDEAHTAQLRRMLSRCEFIATEGLGDYEHAAALYRRCQRAGETVRALTDCLIAAVALRSGVDVLQGDRDFDVIARHTELELFAAPRGR